MSSEFKKQTDFAKKQSKGLSKVFSSNKDNKNVNVSLIKEEAVAKIVTN